MKATFRVCISAWVFLNISCSDQGPIERIPTESAGSANAGVKPACLELASAPSWANGIGAIFQNKCGACHPGSQSTTYNTYAGVKANINVVMMRIDAGTMPTSGPLAQADSAAIHSWITAGMPETDVSIPSTGSTSTGCASTTTTQTPAASAPTPVIPSLEPTYALGVQPIMAAYCSGCHSASGGTTPYLDTITRVKSNYANVMSQINSSGMPLPRNANSKVPADKIAILSNWGTNPNAPYGQWAP